ncbi:MAG: hypothetical protein DIU80_013800 [Chloroflexota bacterium]
MNLPRDFARPGRPSLGGPRGTLSPARLSVVGLALALLALVALLPAAAAAQTVVNAAPLQLTVAATVGEVQQRTLVLEAAAPVSGLSVIVTDMVREDNAAALPLSAVAVGPLAQQIEAGERITVPVTLDLRSVPAGQYAGQLLVSYTSAGAPSTLVIPASISVKDPPHGALLALLIGIAAASLITYYRTQGQPRDELLIRVERLRSRALRDRELMDDPWEREFNRLFDVAALALQSGRASDATAALDTADQLLAKWVQGRTDWARLAAYAAELEAGLADRGLGEGLAFTRAVRQELAEARAAAPSMAAPAELQARLNAVVEQINAFVVLKTQLDDLERLRAQTEQERRQGQRAEEYRRQVAALQQRLAALTPGQPTDDLRSEVAALTEELRNLPPPGRPPVLGEAGAPQPESLPFQEAIPELYRTISGALEREQMRAARQGRNALVRYWLFTAARVLIAILFLAGAGFAQLYLNNAAFGASWWTDYFSLVAWGFSAEASRTAIADLVRGGFPPAGPSSGT